MFPFCTIEGRQPKPDMNTLTIIATFQARPGKEAALRAS
jgi:hypothetical protein